MAGIDASPPMTTTARLAGLSARDRQIEAICQARCMQPGIHWSDGVTEGVARIERMLAERCLDALGCLNRSENDAG